MDLIHDLERLWSFLNGAHLASNDEAATGCFHQACHRLDEIITKIKLDIQCNHTNHHE
jgi:hypothetical protein